jgi:hypothetical protein
MRYPPRLLCTCLASLGGRNRRHSRAHRARVRCGDPGAGQSAHPDFQGRFRTFTTETWRTRKSTSRGSRRRTGRFWLLPSTATRSLGRQRLRPWRVRQTSSARRSRLPDTTYPKCSISPRACCCRSIAAMAWATGSSMRARPMRGLSVSTSLPRSARWCARRIMRRGLRGYQPLDAFWTRRGFHKAERPDHQLCLEGRG